MAFWTILEVALMFSGVIKVLNPLRLVHLVWIVVHIGVSLQIANTDILPNMKAATFDATYNANSYATLSTPWNQI